MSTIAASSYVTFFLALASAHPGDTIALAPGQYSLWNGAPVKMAASSGTPIIVTSADPKHPAVITSLFLNGATGVTLTGLEMDGSGPQRYGVAFSISNSDHVTFDHLNIHGAMTGDVRQVVALAPTGVMVRDSTNFAMTNTEIQRFGNGITHLNVIGLTLKNDSIHDIRTDGIDGGGSSNVLFDGNTITNNWSGASAVQYHPDCMQFWTTNTTASAHDITITNNKCLRGNGDRTQGLFMGNEAGQPYKIVNISGNLFDGLTFHGIAVTLAQNVWIDRNIVGGKDATSWIAADRIDGLSESNNWADTYQIAASNNVALGGNNQNSPGLVGR